jgi:hypothetical protein
MPIAKSSRHLRRAVRSTVQVSTPLGAHKSDELTAESATQIFIVVFAVSHRRGAARGTDGGGDVQRTEGALTYTRAKQVVDIQYLHQIMLYFCLNNYLSGQENRVAKIYQANISKGTRIFPQDTI